MKTLLTPHSSLLTQKRNLLAFSHGLDSTALFHLLNEAKIPFDIALVNYGLRAQADAEEAAARMLAERHGLRAHIIRAPKWESGFEAEARRFRYRFFESLIDQHGYDNLLTAHQMNDALEWMLMRLIRGAGAVELAGMEQVTERTTTSERRYRLFRPLLETPRARLKAYLDEKSHRYFLDESNEDGNYERNLLRHRFANPLIDEYAEGIGRSLRYLREDRQRLLEGITTVYSSAKLRIVEVDTPELLPRAADLQLKELGYLLSGRERRLITPGCSVVIGRAWAVEVRKRRLFIAPYLQEITLPKAYREACRVAGIPPKVRPWLYQEGIDPKSLPGNQE